MRKIENHRAHTLIVCVSAYSTTDDRDRCLAAGMDYFAGKPLTPEKLSQILREAGIGFRPAPSMQICPPPGGPARIDLSILEYLATGSGAPLSRQIERYVAALRAALAELQSIISAADLAETETKAHAILGMAKYVDARALADLAAAVSGAARKGDRSELARLNQRLQETAGRIIDELNGDAPKKP
jgi:CheY-like chemotaxis protein